MTNTAQREQNPHYGHYNGLTAPPIIPSEAARLEKGAQPKAGGVGVPSSRIGGSLAAAFDMVRLKPSSLISLASNQVIVKNTVRSPFDAGDRKRFGFSNREMLRQVVDEPLSAFAEGVRSIKIAMDIRSSSNGNPVVGVTSTLPGEGKSTVASNLARET
jgi:hypothetical protein